MTKLGIAEQVSTKHLTVGTANRGKQSNEPQDGKITLSFQSANMRFYKWE